MRGADIVCCCASAIEPVFFADWLEPGMTVIDVNRNSVEPGFLHAVDVAVRPGDATPYLEKPPPEAFYARGGYLGYVAGQPDDRALVPRVDLTPDIVDIPKLPDLMSGRVPGRTSPEQTAWFMNIGAIGPQFSAVTGGRVRTCPRRRAGPGDTHRTFPREHTRLTVTRRGQASEMDFARTSLRRSRERSGCVKTSHGYQRMHGHPTVICHVPREALGIGQLESGGCGAVRRCSTPCDHPWPVPLSRE